MLETLVATEFLGEVQGGATIPSKMACRRVDGSRVEVYVKCSSVDCGKEGLARDLVGCLLALRLGMRVGEPVLVDVPPELIRLVKEYSPSAAARMSNSVRPFFGSISLGEGCVLCQGVQADAAAGLVRSAAEVWAFDQVFLNVDRNERKPNCLIKGDALAVIDHEKALNVNGMGFLFQPPWDSKWQPDGCHLFSNCRGGRNGDLDRFKSAFVELGRKNGISEIMGLVPSEWVDQRFMEEVSGYLLALYENVDAVFFNLDKAGES